MQHLIPFILEQEKDKIKREIDGKYVSMAPLDLVKS